MNVYEPAVKTTNHDDANLGWLAIREIANRRVEELDPLPGAKSHATFAHCQRAFRASVHLLEAENFPVLFAEHVQSDVINSGEVGGNRFDFGYILIQGFHSAPAWNSSKTSNQVLSIHG